ncbi:MAG: lysophospholipid acyltransferase family protein [Leptospira sp.]|nr:lysophospholipid acyltransferase family protein [Leptospira sp.]
MKSKILSYLIRVILEFWYFFIRVEEIRIPPDTEKLFIQKSGFIFAGWHNQILSMTSHVSGYLQKKRGIVTTPLVSRSKDGELIYETFLRFQMKSVRGSTSKGGASALRGLLKKISQNCAPIFTPDGPRGPVYTVQPGVIQIASMTGLPIVMFNTVFDRYYEAKSWDKQRFPKFGARHYIDYSEPMFVPKGIREEEFQKYCNILETKMKEQEKKLLDLKDGLLKR